MGNTEQGVSWLEHYATERIPELANAHIIKQWSGVRPYTDGELPLWTELTMVYMSLPAIIGTVFYCPLLLVVTSQTGY